MAQRRARRAFGKVAQKGKRFYVEYAGPDGKRHTPGKSFPTRTDADGWLAAEKRLIDLDNWQPPAQRAAQAETTALTVGEWLATFQEQVETRADRIKPSTAANYARVVRVRITAPISPGDTDPDITRLADIRLIHLTKTDVYKWHDAAQRNYPEGRTITHQAYKRLKAALAEAVRRELIPANPAEIPEAAKRPRTGEKYLPSDQEIAAIITAMPDRYRLLAVLTLHHGLRLGEALALETKHVTVEPTPSPLMPRVTITVEQNAQRIAANGNERTHMVIQPPKTRAGHRTIQIMPTDVPHVLNHLANHLHHTATTVNVYGGDNAPRKERGKVVQKRKHLLTTTRNGEIMLDTSYRSVLTRAEERAGVTTDIDPHCGRNWLITRLAEQGAHLREIGALLGQTDVETILNVYMKARPERTQNLMALVNDSLE